jgi:hypothetical protein
VISGIPKRCRLRLSSARTTAREHWCHITCVERWPRRNVAETVYVSERTVYTVWDRVPTRLAYEFGMFRLTGNEKTPTCSPCPRHSFKESLLAAAN